MQPINYFMKLTPMLYGDTQIIGKWTNHRFLFFNVGSPKISFEIATSVRYLDKLPWTNQAWEN